MRVYVVYLDNNDEDFASFATCRFSLLKLISNCLEDIVSHTENTRYQKGIYVFVKDLSL